MDNIEHLKSKLALAKKYKSLSLVVGTDELEEVLSSLQEQVQKLAAENAALKNFSEKLGEMHNDLNGEGTGIQGRSEVACQQVAIEAVIEEFDVIETTATDAVIREIGAKAVERFGDVLGLGSLHLALILKKCAYDHAAKLRAGEQP